jgi:hypothetical protein
VDELIAIQKQGKRVPAELLKAIVLRELATGEKTRSQLDDAAKNETGAKPDSVYKSALAPLKADGLISARKDGLVGHWFWRLSKMDVPGEMGL